jgi:hypothetical protein
LGETVFGHRGWEHAQRRRRTQFIVRSYPLNPLHSNSAFTLPTAHSSPSPTTDHVYTSTSRNISHKIPLLCITEQSSHSPNQDADAATVPATDLCSCEISTPPPLPLRQDATASLPSSITVRYLLADPHDSLSGCITLYLFAQQFRQLDTRSSRTLCPCLT